MSMTLTFSALHLKPAPTERLPFTGSGAQSRCIHVGANRPAAATFPPECPDGDSACLSRAEMSVAALIAECLRPRRFDLF